jgi:hypothetical protein
LQSFEAIQKWFAVVTLAINYLQYTAMLAYRPKQPRQLLVKLLML